MSLAIIKDSLSIEGVLITLAFLIDLLIGDPRWLPHPVRLMGFLIERLELILRKVFRGAFLERIGGIVLVLFMVSFTFFVSCLIVLLYRKIVKEEAMIVRTIALVLFVLLLSLTIATRGLITSSLEVINHLKDGRLYQARRSLSKIVGRDTENLSEEGVLRATLETLSENLSDGIVAPLFYLTIGGLPLAMTYKAINTMDSMIGYKDERYRYFGWAAARLDDIVNFIPARLSAVLIIIAIFFIETSKHIYKLFDELVFKKPAPCRRFLILTIFMVYDFLLILKDIIERGYLFSKRSLFVTLMNGRNHSSPNSGYPEAALAGAIGVKLGGPSTYRGVVVEKPYIGISTRPITPGLAKEAINLITLSALMAGFFAALVRL